MGFRKKYVLPFRHCSNQHQHLNGKLPCNVSSLRRLELLAIKSQSSFTSNALHWIKTHQTSNFQIEIKHRTLKLRQLNNGQTYSGCNWYGFGAMFFGCLSMVIHGSISLVRCVPLVHPDFGYQQTIRSTVALLGTNVIYSGIFALGEGFIIIILFLSFLLILFTIFIVLHLM